MGAAMTRPLVLLVTLLGIATVVGAMIAVAWLGLYCDALTRKDETEGDL